NGPAYKAGMRSGDMLVGVNDANGKRVDLKGAEVDDAVNYIKGPLNSTVVVYVKRRGVEKEMVFEVKRQEIEVDTALEEMLPGSVGYVRLTRFGANSADDMKKALANLQKQGMKSLVLDLRDNPGGQLTAVLDIADLFLKPGTLISTAGGVWGTWKGRQRYEVEEPKTEKEKSEPKYYDVPMIVMINENSASGSEMLSGALKDNNRATVVGQPSYGKGIGQSFFTIRSSDRVLKCTVFSYYLPSGITIDRVAGVGGVTPHITSEAEYLEAWEVYARDRLLKLDSLEQYLDTWYRGETKEKLMKLAVFDARDAALWPEFDKFYASLSTPLSKEDVRRELRFKLRTRVADDRAAEFTQNFQEDSQLLVGLTELFKKAGGDIKGVSEYAAVLGK
ncbi:partial putative CtpA-like serine protease, partial [Anaerolineae bacterium]